MAKSRNRVKDRTRKENTREERKVIADRNLLTFSFKDLDQTQPKKDTETLQRWIDLDLIKPLIGRLSELSNLTRDEATNQKQIKIYGNFPKKDITHFFHPDHIDQHVCWGVIEGIGGRPRIAGYVSENTFYIVFLDSEHRFWISEKKNT